MSVDVLQSPFQLEKYGWLAREEQQCHAPLEMVAVEDNKLRPDDQLDIWSRIQAEKVTEPPPAAPYLHPLARRRSLSSMSLQICTERLGSETGSDDFTSLHDVVQTEHAEKQSVEFVHEENIVVVDEAEERSREAKGTMLVNYHCSIGRRTPARCFPPPLPSISHSNGRPCLKMQPHRRDGRLVIEAVPSPSRKYLHALREDGRLILCFVEPASDAMAFQQAEERLQFEEDIMEENEADEKEEEGTEAIVSTQPQQQGGGPESEIVTTASTGATTTVATLGLGGKTEQSNELSLTSKRLDREEMLRRCSELRGIAWFICDPCIATSY